MNKLERTQQFTIEEVNERLPLLERIIRDLMVTLGNRDDVREQLTHFRRELAGSGSAEVTETIRRLEEDEERSGATLVALKNEVEQLGGVLRDPEQGFVDFFSEVEGRLAFLSWEPGELEIEFFHEIDETERKAL